MRRGFVRIAVVFALLLGTLVLVGLVLREPPGPALPPALAPTGRPATQPARVPTTRPVRLPRVGLNLTADQVRDHEERLKARPDDLELRCELLGYYTRNQFSSVDARNARVEHVLWIIRHHPDDPIAGWPESSFNAILEPAAYRKAAKLWEEQVKAHGDSAPVLGNAAGFFLLHDRGKAEELLKRARDLDPSNPEWSAQLGRLYMLSAQSAWSKEDNVQDARLALESFEHALEHAARPFRPTMLKDVARAAFEAGEFDKAERFANELLHSAVEGDSGRGRGGYPEAVHHGNIILGRISLRRGEVEPAEAHLLRAGLTPGSPSLNSFGPNMTLAHELLEAGKKETVLEYLKRCGTFWKDPKLAGWIGQVEQGRTPAWGANLRY